MSNRKFKNYKKFDVVCADFEDNLPGVQGGVRVGVVVSCDASNHTGAPQVSVVPLTSKLKDIPVHVQLTTRLISWCWLTSISLTNIWKHSISWMMNFINKHV